MSVRYPKQTLRLDQRVWQAYAMPLLLALGSPAAEAQSPQSPKDPLRAAYLADARKYQFVVGAAGEHPLAMEPQPVLHWASPDDWSGDIFLWSHAGRPEMIGCMLAGPAENGRRLFYHEFHALTTERLPAQSLPNGREWNSSEPGIRFQTVPNAPPVADGEASRLRQMRSLIREFSAHTEFNYGRWELRLLTQPVFRYRRPEGTTASAVWLDGAIFTYVLTTGIDAEVALVLEARAVADGYAWQYAPVRLTNRPAWMKFRQDEIWRVDRHDETNGAISGPYTTFYADTREVPTAAPSGTE